MYCIAFSLLDAASYKPSISFSGVDSSDLLICVSSKSFDMVFMRLVWHLFEFTSQDTRYIQDVQKFKDPSSCHQQMF